MPTLAQEGFAIRALDAGGQHAIVLAGATVRSRVYAAGWLLRRATGTDVNVYQAVDEAPEQAVRGTQIGYRFKNNSYDAWTVGMFARRIEDFVLFGANRIQLIAPISDDEPTSPLFPAPALETLQGIARVADRYGIDVGLYYPALGDYGTLAAIVGETSRFRALIAAMPRIDALYVPGGDPGHTAPDRLFPLVAQEASILHSRFPKAEVLVSTQGFDANGLDAFYRQVDRGPRWLTGIFIGPQTRDPVSFQRARIPARYAVELYPDIGHTMHAQFPVPQWSPAFALTEGREPINPRPAGYAEIHRHFAGMSRGFVAYSEGVNDDFNQMLLFRLGWSSRTSPADIATDYARMFIGDDRGAAIPAALERNWIGDPSTNAEIDATLDLADAVQPAGWADWRLDSFRYRAVYDAVVRRRYARAKANETNALKALRLAPTLGIGRAVAAARGAYARLDDAATQALRSRLFSLADSLWRDPRLQLSVPRYGASSVERGANLDRVDVSLNDRVAVERGIGAALALPGEAAQTTALANFGDPGRASEQAIYDDLGNPGAEPHLVRGKKFAADPQMYDSAIDGIADRTPDNGWRMAEISYAETLYDSPIRLHYEGLDPHRRYRLVATYAGEDYWLPMRLVANGSIELHPPRDRPENPMRIDLPLPAQATRGGTLDLAWTRPPGVGGGGRGHQVAEVWLIPEQ